MIPDLLVHYYLPDKKPFQNLSDIDGEEKKKVVEELNQRSEKGLMKRAFPDWYFKQRKEAEENLLQEVKRLGGTPERNSPHYFCLGESIGMQYIYNHNYKTLVLPINQIESPIYFSIGDTLWTFSKSYKPNQDWNNKWYQGKLYNYEEVSQIIREINLDLSDKGSLNKSQVFHIEALVYSDSEIEKWLQVL